jgi:hypothetical protein
MKPLRENKKRNADGIPFLNFRMNYLLFYFIKTIFFVTTSVPELKRYK